MSAEQTELDGLFMSALQQGKNGIDGFFFNLFGFLRRRSDYFQMDAQCMEIIKKNYDAQHLLFKEDKARQDALVKKREAEKAKALAEEKKKKDEANASGATEVTDEEAEQIMKEEAARKAKLEAGEDPDLVVPVKKEETKADGDEEELDKDGKKKDKGQLPNSGNGGSTEKYDWIQTLDEVTVFVKFPEKCTAKNIDVNMTNTKIKTGLKGGETILEGEWFKKIKMDETMWSLESDGDKRILQLTLQKFEGQQWWGSVLKGDVAVDTQKVEPESSKLSDLDLETRAAVEKMMFDQNQKMMGKPTIEEMGKRDKLKGFMEAHPEMDFSKCKFM